MHASKTVSVRVTCTHDSGASFVFKTAYTNNAHRHAVRTSAVNAVAAAAANMLGGRFEVLATSRGARGRSSARRRGSKHVGFYTAALPCEQSSLAQPVGQPYQPLIQAVV